MNIPGVDYIPYGSQYYRAPSPKEEDWAEDLKRMADYGFNMVKFWVQWRWNHPKEDKYYFDDIDRLMDLAEENGLKVMLNTIFDVAPAWIYEKYPDASMVTLSGRKIAPQTQPHRQIGGLGYCYNHDGVMKHFFEFLEETVKRYKHHPALAVWNVGSEPELTSSMAEMRAYADDSEKMNDMLCYCENCRRKFKKYVKNKYKNIDSLNKSWNRNYSNFSNVELPLTRNTFNDMIDWRMFFVDTLGKNIKQRFDVAKEIDQGQHPLMCHHVFIQGFPITSTASDPWNVGKYGDLHGFTQMNDPMMIDVLRSSARDKPVISAEMLMLPGYTLDLPQSIDIDDIKRFIFSGIAGNLKGFVFWQYRPEILGREAPTWGLTDLDGNETERLKGFAEVGKVIKENEDFLLNAKPEPAKVAIMYHPENQIFGWAATGNEKNVTQSLLGAHKVFYENNYNVDFIHPDEINDSLLSQYKVIVLPFSYLIGQKVAQNLKKWVNEGGFLIGESYLAGWNREAGHHSKVVPGYGLDSVFQTRQGVADPISEEDGKIIKITDEDYFSEIRDIQGQIVQTRLISQGAKVLGEFSDGSPALTLGTYGKGKALLIGSYTFLPCYRTNAFAIEKFLISLTNRFTDLESPPISSNGKIRMDLLKSDSDEKLLILRNLEEEDVVSHVSINESSDQELQELFSNRKLKPEKFQNCNKYKISFQPHEVKVYRG
ncbi:MAG: beta-galactosidase, partial [Candidatus Marinimicrobia bacterium]|nr:beta-galactosidase [Candidatus Neomarinimicrobiota bacterium]